MGGIVTSPCKDCKERSQTCHAECEQYIRYSAEQAELREKYNQKVKIDGWLYEAEQKRNGRR